MDLDEYKTVLAGRFESLNDDEKDSLRSIMGTPASLALGKIFGPEMGSLINMGQVKKPVVKKRGLGTR